MRTKFIVAEKEEVTEEGEKRIIPNIEDILKEVGGLNIKSITAVRKGNEYEVEVEYDLTEIKKLIKYAKTKGWI